MLYDTRRDRDAFRMLLVLLSLCVGLILAGILGIGDMENLLWGAYTVAALAGLVYSTSLQGYEIRRVGSTICRDYMFARWRLHRRCFALSEVDRFDVGEAGDSYWIVVRLKGASSATLFTSGNVNGIKSLAEQLQAMVQEASQRK